MHVATLSGERFDPLKRTISKVSIHDLAHGLGMICRYNGQCKHFFSVAQHSWLVMEHFKMKCEHDGIAYSVKALKAALMHDAAEYLMGDMISPIKALFPEYKAIENTVAATIAGVFQYDGLPPWILKRIKQADLEVRAKEKLVLMPNSTEDWEELIGIEPSPLSIHYLQPETAGRIFLRRFRDLCVLDQALLVA